MSGIILHNRELKTLLIFNILYCQPSQTLIIRKEWSINIQFNLCILLCSRYVKHEDIESLKASDRKKIASRKM